MDPDRFMAKICGQVHYTPSVFTLAFERTNDVPLKKTPGRGKSQHNTPTLLFHWNKSLIKLNKYRVSYIKTACTPIPNTHP